ncbi:MAG TPA: FHA domain-containing protein [Nitrospinota bacterium]|jgi:predicted Zn finger-like uncharacterized protein|nr:FHA domain-containing protein [Nitrospinota bacterium]
MTDLIKISCPKCQTKYNISPSKFPKQGSIKLNCKKCGTSFNFAVPDESKNKAVEDIESSENTDHTEIASRTIIGHALSGSGGIATKSSPKDCKITLTYKINNEEIEKVIDSRLTIIGRTEGDIKISDPLMSRKHASIEIKSPTMVELRDLASTNGILHNNMKVNSVLLQSGDEIKLGSTVIHFSSEIKFT